MNSPLPWASGCMKIKALSQKNSGTIGSRCYSSLLRCLRFPFPVQPGIMEIEDDIRCHHREIDEIKDRCQVIGMGDDFPGDPEYIPHIDQAKEKQALPLRGS